MKLVALFVIIGLVYASAMVADTIQGQFVEFQSKYNKFYANPTEYNYRLEVFASNVKAAQLLSAQYPQTQYGITKFMDLTPAEFKANFLMSKLPPTETGIIAPKLNISAPTSFDWRNQAGVVTPVYNQGQCGSCWAFSATENIESRWALAGHTLTSLSMQQIVDCDPYDYGCGGGWPYNAYKYVMGAGGQDSYASYPYTAVNGNCAFSAANIVAKLSNWVYVTQSQDEGQMINYLVANGPLSICVDASSWQYYTGGVLMASSCTTNIDHCVDAIGYNLGANPQYWSVRNSWGTDWGMNGYIQLQYGQDTCAMAQVVTSSIAA
jgi:C1A family cysteine protease